jgi:hypothetical protein
MINLCEEKDPYHALESVFEDERLIVPLTSTESERRSVSEYAKSIGSFVDLKKAYSKLFDLCPSLERELKLSELRTVGGFFLDEYSEGRRAGITSPDVLFFGEHNRSKLLNDCTHMTVKGILRKYYIKDVNRIPKSKISAFNSLLVNMRFSI